MNQTAQNVDKLVHLTQLAR